MLEKLKSKGNSMQFAIASLFFIFILSCNYSTSNAVLSNPPKYKSIAKVLIITHCYSRPDFITLQKKLFEKFLDDDYEFVVFNDAQTESMANLIETVCKENELLCIRIPQDIHTLPYLPRLPEESLQQSNVRHANCVQFSLDVLGFDHLGIVFIVDSDMFLLRNFSISHYMEPKDIAAFTKTAPGNIFCLCPALTILNMPKLPDVRTLNFNCGRIYGFLVDSGGWTHYYLKDHSEVKVTSVTTLYSQELFLADTHTHTPANESLSNQEKIDVYKKLGFNESEIRFLLKKPHTFEFYLDNLFLHFRGGSTLDIKEMHKNKVFAELINEILI